MSGFARKLAIIAVLAFVLSCTASLAYAASPDGLTTVSPSFTHTYDPNTGASAWTYKDVYDSAAKTEGSYAAFDNGTLYNNPHGGYDSTTNKCKVCHAVHRAEGAYYLLRADTQDDACSYCHIGGSAHSRKVVYDLNPDGIQTSNGHTIGASSVIPDSSVKQWTEDVTLSTVDADGNPVTETIQVRRYYERRNKMFRFGRHHGQSATASSAGRSAYHRIGPLALRCMNCHQPHNATDLIWKPYSYDFFNATWTPTNGYKLLRASPSGSIKGTANVIGGAGWPIWLDGESTLSTAPQTADWAMQNRVGFLAGQDSANKMYGVGYPNVVRAVETTHVLLNTSPLIYTTETFANAYDEYKGDPTEDPGVVTQFALSYWCADCHNLNIGYWQETSMEFGFKSHSDRTHPAPYVGSHSGPGQCYSCHRNDLPLMSGSYTAGETWNPFTTGSATIPSGFTGSGSCAQCHYGTSAYQANHYWAEQSGKYAFYDFPHSGGTNYIKMLGPWTAYLDGSGTMQTTMTTVSSTNLDAVCKRCHPGIGVRH